MKKSLPMLLLTILLAMAMLLPVCAATSPADSSLATARTRIAETVGVDTAGAAVGILKGGECVFLEGFGYADITGERLITPETVFEIGDISAIFVALAAYRLEEQGVLSLTSGIDTYLPAAFYAELGLSYPVNTEQLLLGCAGFDGRTFDLSFQKESHRFDTLPKALLAEVPVQIAMPGEFYSYSPFGIALAAYVVECATGRSYAEYVTTDILTPLGMVSTVLNPDDTAASDKRACGHVKENAGVFAVGAHQGYSYAGLYPVDGALSTPEDLNTLLAFLLGGNEAVLSNAARTKMLTTVLENGIFAVAAPALSVQGAALGTTGGTSFFGASLWIDPTAGIGAFALTNTADSALLSLPAELCGATVGKTVEVTEGFPGISVLEGTYVTAAGEDRSFVGRMYRKDHGETVEVSEDGTILFRGMRLRQIGVGVFGDAAAEAPIALVQFVLGADGEVVRVVTADGNTYLPVSFWEQQKPATVLFYALLFLTAGFLFAGIFSLIFYLLRRNDPDSKGFVYTLPLLFATLMSIFVLLQMWVGIEYGAAAFSSFFGAMSLLTLFCSIGAIVCLLVAFAASLTRRKMPARVAYTSVLFIAFLLLVNMWGFSAW